MIPRLADCPPLPPSTIARRANATCRRAAPRGPWRTTIWIRPRRRQGLWSPCSGGGADAIRAGSPATAHRPGAHPDAGTGSTESALDRSCRRGEGAKAQSVLPEHLTWRVLNYPPWVSTLLSWGERDRVAENAGADTQSGHCHTLCERPLRSCWGCRTPHDLRSDPV